VNVCRHRGHLLCDADARRETIQCPYHAWTYDLDGKLRSAPRAEREDAFDPGSLSLVPVSADTWGPFVFVNPDRDAPPLAEALGELPRLLAEGGVDVESLRFHSRAEGDYACNWKVCAENYLECYHCAVAHPSFSQALDVSPDAYALSTNGLLLSQSGPPRSHDADGTVGHGQFHLLFPATLVNVMPGRQNLSIGPVVPRGAERTYRFLVYFVGDDADEEWLRGYLELDELVGAEDRALVESVQRGISSGALESGVLLPESEQLIARFQALVLEALGVRLKPETGGLPQPGRTRGL
jgi:choline monooxygenase